MIDFERCFAFKNSGTSYFFQDFSKIL